MQRTPRDKTMPRSLAGTMLLALMMGCGEDNPTGPGQGGTSAEVADYLDDLPTWSAFTADVNGPDQAPAATGAPTPLPDEVVPVREYEEDGEVTVLPEVTYQCISTPYSMTSNPAEIVMYDPDASILWPGGLIQGKSRKALGSLLGLPIAERAPLEIFIDEFATGDNRRVVENPTAGTVSSAKGEIVGNATASGLSAASSIDFSMQTHHSVEQVGLSASLSGAYFGYSAKVGTDFSRNAAENTITANFIQRMFTVSVAEPATPDAFFTSDLTPARLEAYKDRMGPDNLPVYISDITYGRMMTFSMTSTASETDMKATLRARYESIGVDVSLALDARQRRILQEAEFKVTSIGGNAQATLDMIRTGDWSAYFTDSPKLSDAAPLAYTFRNLGDGSIAAVTEATSYDIKSCTAVPATPGTFTFLDPQVESAPFTGGVTSLTGDVNGDGRTDLIFNQLQQGNNRLFVGISAGDGTFDFTAPFAHPESAPEGWGNYTVKVVNWNGDPYADLVWNLLGASNKTYIGLGNGDGTFGTPAVRIHPASPTEGWGAYRLAVGDMMGPVGASDGREDLAWVRWGSASTPLGVHLGRSDASQLLVFQPFQAIGGTYANNRLVPANVDGDDYVDLVLNTTGTPNTAVVVKSDGDGTWTVDPGSTTNTNPGNWALHQARPGRVDASGRDALIWTDGQSATSAVSVGRWNGSDFVYTYQTNIFDRGTLTTTPLDVRIADVEGDGWADIVWNLRSSTVNKVFVSLGLGDGTFSFSTVPVSHPDVGVDWALYQMFTGDVNGDGREDIIWTHPAATNRIYTAIGKQ